MAYTQNNPQTLTAGLKKYSDKFLVEMQNWAIPLSGFATNFSDEISVDANGGIFVPYVNADTTGDYNDSTKNFKTGSSPQKQGANVELTAHKINQFLITPTDVAHFRPAFWDGKAQMNAVDLATTIFGDIAKVAIDSKVPNTHKLATTLGIEDIVELAKVATAHKIKPQLATLYLTNTDYFDFLKAMKYDVTGNTAIINGNLNGVLVGFKQIVCLPPQCNAGFVAMPDFVCVAGRPYVGGMVGSGGEIISEQVITEGDTGLPFVQTVVRDGGTKNLIHSVDCWYGAELGNKNAGIKLTRGE
jgi:hypothetical protein